MNEFNVRVTLKHDSEENWNKAINFIPKAGEAIVYDADASHIFNRIKIGDGKTKVSDLPFVTRGIDRATIDQICNTEFDFGLNEV